MPQRARLSVAGVPWHIIQRGNNRSACFFSDEDYQYYLDTFNTSIEPIDGVVLYGKADFDHV